MKWQVNYTKRTVKQLSSLNETVNLATRLLTEDLRNYGPIPGKSWHNYSKLKGKKSEDKRHCHLIKGNPTYVCCWEIIDKRQKVIEVYYVGTHEKAPY